MVPINFWQNSDPFKKREYFLTQKLTKIEHFINLYQPESTRIIPNQPVSTRISFAAYAGVFFGQEGTKIPIGGTQWMGGTSLDGGGYPLDAAISKKLDDILVNRKTKSKRVLIRMHWRGRRVGTDQCYCILISVCPCFCSMGHSFWLFVSAFPMSLSAPCAFLWEGWGCIGPRKAPRDGIFHINCQNLLSPCPSFWHACIYSCLKLTLKTKHRSLPPHRIGLKLFNKK